MKKILFLLCAVLLFSCTSDDENTSPIQNPTFELNFLLKRWTYDKVGIDDQIFTYQHQQNCMPDEFTFTNQEGQIRQYNEVTFINDVCSANGLNLEWKLKKDKISMYFGTQLVVTLKIISVTENQLIFSYSTDANNDGVEELITIYAIPYL